MKAQGFARSSPSVDTRLFLCPRTADTLLECLVCRSQLSLAWVCPSYHNPLLMSVWTPHGNGFYTDKCIVNHRVWYENINDAFFFSFFPGVLPLLLQDIGNSFKVLAFYESGFMAPDLPREFNKGEYHVRKLYFLSPSWAVLHI